MDEFFLFFGTENAGLIIGLFLLFSMLGVIFGLKRLSSWVSQPCLVNPDQFEPVQLRMTKNDIKNAYRAYLQDAGSRTRQEVSLNVAGLDSAVRMTAQKIAEGRLDERTVATFQTDKRHFLSDYVNLSNGYELEFNHYQL